VISLTIFTNPLDVYPAIVDKFLEYGYSEEDCGKILGGNMLRVFEQVWY
jgi:membrane dipeptidase